MEHECVRQTMSSSEFGSGTGLSYLIESAQQLPCERYAYFADEETKAQRGEETQPA